MSQQVNSDAKRIREITGRPMAECRQQAQQIETLCREMKTRIVEFYFVKKDGTTRQAFGTLQDDIILPRINSDSNRKPNPDLVTYYDTVAQNFRSFRKENFKSYVA